MRPVAETKSKRKPSWLAKTALERGLAAGGCPVCWSLRRVVRRYIFSFLYEGMMSPSAREAFLKGGGFCQQHFWQAKDIEAEHWADGFGLAILCENLLARSLQDVRQIPESRPGKKPALLGISRRSSGQPASFALTPGSGCRACAVLRESENHYLTVLEELLQEADFGERYQGSAGLCLQHLRMAAETWHSSPALTLVKSNAERVVLQLLAELREFQRKHDYQYRHEPRGAESTSPERAITFLAGMKADTDASDEVRATERRPR